MANNLEITIYDFEHICRTCLSREDLKPLYEKCSWSTCLAEMLMSCTPLKFTEDDGLPVKICINCINEINQAFSFAKRCETTDTILRKCIKIKTELGNNSSQSPKAEPIIQAEERMQIEINPEIILPNIHRTADEVLGNFEYVAIKQEEDEQTEYEYDSTYNNPARESYEQDFATVQDETYSEESDNPIAGPNRRSTNYGIEEESSKDEDSYPTGEEEAKLPDQILSRDFQCTECDRAFKNKALLKQHSATHLEKKFSCSVCRRGFVNEALLDKHSKVHTGVDPYACPVCGKAFSQLGTLKTHKLIHTGEKPNVCSICSKAFVQATHLKRHMGIHSGDKPYTCELCSKTFTRPNQLKYHMSVHTGEKPHACEVCGKTFPELKRLQYHMNIHSGEKPYTCEVCSKAFTRLDYLKNHMSIHTGEKPYSCGVCSKAFVRQEHLKNHMNMHTGKKPYTCKVCSKAFTRHSYLKYHMSIHTGEKPYTCGVCKKAFTRPNILKQHMLTHTDEKKPDTG